MSQPTATPQRRLGSSALRLPRPTTAVGRAGLRFAVAYFRFFAGATVMLGIADALTECEGSAWLLVLDRLALAPTSLRLLPEPWDERGPVAVLLLIAVATLNAVAIAAGALLVDAAIRTVRRRAH